MAFSFQVGPSVLALIWSGTGSGAGTVTGARTQCHSVSGTGNGADVGPGLRAGAGARADVAPGAGAGVWAGESEIADNVVFADVTLKKVSVSHGFCTDLRIPGSTLFHPVGAQR